MIVVTIVRKGYKRLNEHKMSQISILNVYIQQSIKF